MLFLVIGTKYKSNFGGEIMDDTSPEALFNKWAEQKQKREDAKMGPVPGMNPQDGINPEQQKILNEVTTSTPSVAPVSASQGTCPECGLIHPPLAPGLKCPNAKIKIDGVSDSQVNLLVVQIKDILTSQLEQKGIKKYDNFKNGLIMALMKYCEEYKE
jgi:hypothetical protein